MFKVGDILINTKDIGTFSEDTTYKVDYIGNDIVGFDYMDLTPTFKYVVQTVMPFVSLKDKKWVHKIDYDRRKKLEKICSKLEIK